MSRGAYQSAFQFISSLFTAQPVLIGHKQGAAPRVLAPRLEVRAFPSPVQPLPKQAGSQRQRDFRTFQVGFSPLKD